MHEIANKALTGLQLVYDLLTMFRFKRLNYPQPLGLYADHMNGRSHSDSRTGAEKSTEAEAHALAMGFAFPRWRFLVLARVENFSLLRRHLGRARSDRLAPYLVERLTSLLPGSRVTSAARDSIEVGFESEDRGSLQAQLDKLVDLFSRPIQIDGEFHDIDMLFGAAVSDGVPADDLRLIEQAEHALARADGESRAVIFDVDALSEAMNRIALAHDLDRAIERGELFLQYQPKMHLRQQEITSVEALIRWRHPIRGLVLPGDFIPLAEETRAITALTLWTIRQALADQATLAAHGHNLRVFVNIAGVLLSDGDFVRAACELVTGRTDKIGFEVTETSVIRDPESAIANLETFAAIGVEIAIDDYGAGLSSLAYLKRLPARELKIDKLFVTQLTSTNRDPLIVRSTIDLAHALEMAVVAEGVETQAAMALLAVMGCDIAQGFLISRPVNLNALIAFLEDGRHVQALEESRAAFNGLAETWKYGS